MEIRIGVITYTHTQYGRQILRGLIKYREEHEHDWHVQAIWRVQGDPQYFEHLREYDVVVNGWSDADQPLIPRPSVRVCTDTQLCPGCVVDIDNDAVGVVAAKHLLERGARTLASVRSLGGLHARIRGFDRIAAGNGQEQCYTVHCVDGGLFTGRYQPVETALTTWMTLPRPIGLFVETDSAALTVHQSLQAVGLRIPEDVLLMGVDNDEFVCTLPRPGITSIAMPYELAGFRAGEMITRFLQTKRWPASPKLLAPLGLVARGSTQLMVRDDDLIAAALKIIRAHVSRGETIRVPDLAGQLAVSVRTLQDRFRRATGHTVVHGIAKARVTRAEQLLRDVDTPLKIVARRTGFSSVSRFSDVFRRITGTTPGAFRRCKL